MKAQKSGSVIGTDCSSPTHDMLWIWTGTQDLFLLNIQTLKCMGGKWPIGGRQSPGNVGVQPCHKNVNLQKMKCFFLRRLNQTTIAWNNWAKNDRNVPSLRLLQLNDENHAVATIGGKQIWKNKRPQCGTLITYTGKMIIVRTLN